MSDATPTLRSHRLGLGLFFAWVLLAMAAVFGIQALWTGSGPSRWVSALACVAIVCACVLLGLRPVVRELPEVVEVRNPLRTAVLPWASITDVDASDVVRISAGPLVVRCFALPRRDRRPLTSGVASFFGGRSVPEAQPAPSARTTGDVVEALSSRASELRSGASGVVGAEPRYTYDPGALGVLGLGLVCLLACMVVAIAA